MVAIEGVDYAFARPQPKALVNAGKKFVVRYGGPGSDSKHLHAAELAALRAVGLDVVANAEGTAGGYVNAAAGRSWAQQAEEHFRALGMPADRPIYFSVDFDAGPGDWAGVDAALRASAQVLGAARVGVYGSYDTIAHCRAAGTAAWFWQTYAWSGGRQHPGAHLYQYRNGVTLGGGDCDLNRALTVDYGQWGYQEDIVPITNADVDVALKRDAITNPRQRADAATNPTVSVGWAISDTYAQVYNLRDQVTALGKSLGAAIAALAAKDQVDEAKLATELAPAIVALLPGDRDDITVQELTEAIRALIVPAAG